MKTAAIVFAVVASAPAPMIFTVEDMQRAITTATEFGRLMGIAEMEKVLDDARRMHDRCAFARPI